MGQLPARFPRWDSCPCEVSKMGQLPLRGFQDGTAAPARFPRWDSCPCEFSKMGQLPLRVFQDGKDIPARFPGWDGYSCLVSRMGHILRSFENGTHSCEVWTGQIFLRVSHDGTVFPARCTGWNVSAMFPHWDRGFQNDTDFRASYPRQDRRSAMFTRYKPP